jgi:uroporphyrinogen-III synthase
VFPQVTRYNTYTIVPAVWTEDELASAHSVDIVTLASPSATRIWNDRVGHDQVAVVIGPTTESAAQKLGFSTIHTPKVVGLDEWAKLIVAVAEGLARPR